MATLESESNYTDEYIYEDAYYDSILHGTSTKHDAGSTQISTKQRRIPIHRLKEDDEIPPMPSVVIEKPNEAHFNKLVKEQQDKIEKHSKNIEQIYEQIESEKFGKNNEERKKMKEKNNTLFEKSKALTEKIKLMEVDLNPILNRTKEIKDQKEQLFKECEFKDYKKLEAEIKSCSDRVAFGNLSVGEEKLEVARKAKLESQKPKVK